MKTILVIEDNAEMRENTAEILELADYHVITAENGKLGIELSELSHPDLIISDITMPEADGFEVLKAVRKSVADKKIPFIFLTARNEKENQNAAKELGAYAYLMKPFDGNQLLKIVSEKLIGLS